MAPIDSHVLVQRARLRAPDAWRALVERSQDRVWRLAWLLLPDEAAAADASVDAYVRAARDLMRRPARGSFFALVARELVRTAREARVRRPAAAPPKARAEGPETLAPLRALPTEDAAALALRFALDVSEREAMEALGCSRREFERRVAQALGRLRALAHERRPPRRGPGAPPDWTEVGADWEALAATAPRPPADLMARVMRRLEAPERRLAPPRAAALALAAVAVAAAGFGTAVVVLATSDAVREWLRVGPSAAPVATSAPSPTPLPTPTPLAARGFARPVTLEEARRLASFPLMFPQGWPGPDAVYLWEPQQGNPVVILSYLDGGFDLYEGPLAASFDEPPVEIARVEVNGAPARWLEGGAIVLHYLDAEGRPVVERKRIVERNTLVWERSGVTLRMETSRALPFALAIAGAVR
ncbi:MAG TPA: hypothetical protein VNM43_08735 [Dehalococcoidia bacterium]|nr:hypothetical protein [Dehalococcoidia bacterium]